MRNLKIIRDTDTINIEQAPLSLAQKPLLSFRLVEEGLDSLSRVDRFAIINRRQKGELEISFGNGALNIMAFGGTGEGKTRTVLLPAFRQLVTAGCPGLVLDIKNSLEQEGRRLKAEGYNVMLLGASTDSVKCNIIADFDTSKLRDFLSNLLASYHTNDKYWGSTGLTDALMIARFIKETTGYDASLADLYYYLANPRDFVAMVQYNRGTNNEPRFHAMCRELDRHMEMYQFCFLKAGGYKGSSLDRSSSDSDGRNQYEWQTGALKSVLKPFYENPIIRENFCSNQALDFQKLIYDENAVLVLNLPYAIFGEISFTVAKLLRARFYDAVKGMGEAKLQSMGYGRDKFTFMLVDEYQQFIDADQDKNWLDSSRGYGNINLLSMQSVTSGFAENTNAYAVQTIIQNCRNVICYSTSDSNTIAMMQTLFSGVSDPATIADLLLHPVGNHVFVYQGRDVDTRTSAYGICETGKSSIEAMNRFLKPQAFTEFAHSKESMAAIIRSHLRHDRKRSAIKLRNPFPDLISATDYQEDWDQMFEIATKGPASAVLEHIMIRTISDCLENNTAMSIQFIRNSLSFEEVIKAFKIRRDLPEPVKKGLKVFLNNLPDFIEAVPKQSTGVYEAYSKAIEAVSFIMNEPEDGSAFQDYAKEMVARYFQLTDKGEPSELLPFVMTTHFWNPNTLTTDYTNLVTTKPKDTIERELDALLDDDEEVNVFINEGTQKEVKPEDSDEWKKSNEAILDLLDRHGVATVRSFLAHVKECFLPLPDLENPDEDAPPYALTESEIERLNRLAGCSEEEAKKAAQAVMGDLQKLTQYPTTEIPRLNPLEFVAISQELSRQLGLDEEDEE